MKRIVVLLMLLLIVPPVTALAASCTSRRFVVRNWKAEVPSTPEPTSTEEPVDEQAGEMDEVDPSDEDISAVPSDSTMPPIFTEDVETVKQGETEPDEVDEVELVEEIEPVKSEAPEGEEQKELEEVDQAGQSESEEPVSESLDVG